MGRGRAKAKQTKVARELKYSSPQTDFERLQRELAGSDASDPTTISTAPTASGPTRTTGAASRTIRCRGVLSESWVLAHELGARAVLAALLDGAQ